MPNDPRTRFHVLQPILAKHGRCFWLKVGVAYKSTDGTIDAYLDSLVYDRFRLREYTPAEYDQIEPGVEPAESESFS